CRARTSLYRASGELRRGRRIPPRHRLATPPTADRARCSDAADPYDLASIAFRQNITIQFCSNLLPVEREEAGTPHPCVSVSIRGQIACFLWRSVSSRSLVFGPRMDTDRMFSFY